MLLSSAADMQLPTCSPHATEFEPLGSIDVGLRGERSIERHLAKSSLCELLWDDFRIPAVYSNSRRCCMKRRVADADSVLP
jgi:hypothetical protein